MEKNCDFCCKSKAVVFCKADVARLCLSCDTQVHSANTLSRNHQRSLLCEGCGIQPVAIQCIDHKLFMCDSCNQNFHGTLVRHRKRAMKAYRGCPSTIDFSMFWGYDLNFPGDDKDLGVNISYSSLLGDMGNDWVPAASLDLMLQGTSMSAGKEFCPWIDEASTPESELSSLNQTFVLEYKPSSYKQQNKVEL